MDLGRDALAIGGGLEAPVQLLLRAVLGQTTHSTEAQPA